MLEREAEQAPRSRAKSLSVPVAQPGVFLSEPPYEDPHRVDRLAEQWDEPQSELTPDPGGCTLQRPAIGASCDPRADEMLEHFAGVCGGAAAVLERLDKRVEIVGHRRHLGGDRRPDQPGEEPHRRLSRHLKRQGPVVVAVGLP